MNIRIPGNLLLTGEYAVLSEGGKGISLAVNRYFRLTSQDHDVWNITSLYPGKTEDWYTGKKPFLDSLVSFLKTEFPGSIPQSVILDSRELFHLTGKLGLGSSACVALGLCALFHSLHHGRRSGIDELSQLCVEAHRYAQGGKGSGYDVLTSLYGGYGIFRGGKHPSREKIPPPALTLSLFRGKEAVRTAGAIHKWDEYRHTHPDDWDKYLELNEKIVEMARQGDWELCLQQARDWGISLGRALGVEAAIHAPSSALQSRCKSSGAGNEIGLTWAKCEYNPDLMPVIPSEEGLIWE